MNFLLALKVSKQNKKQTETQLKKEQIMKNVDELYKTIIMPIKVTLILMMS